MEDQFGGRTDDDLFYDDFEPVESEPVLTSEQPTQPTPPQLQQQATTPPAVAQPASKPKSSSKPHQSLSASIYADKPPPSDTNQSKPQEAKAPVEDEQQAAVADAQSAPTPPPNAPTAPREKRSQRGGATANTAARLGSGANPRQKLTDTELAAKMEKMKLLSAEKAAKFEKAEKDEKQHAEAYARGMEEARKRRAEDAERRKRGEEDRKKLEDERAKNRERKLKAMGMKEGGWDEGKEAQEEEERRNFKGANGGIRGTRGGGLGGSRYAKDGEEQPDVDRFLDDRHRGGRGRGRGGRGGGRGGRGGHDGAKPAPKPQSVPTATDFPALPSDGKQKSDTSSTTPSQPAKSAATVAAAPAPAPLSFSPPIGSGKWDDEMEELDQARAKAG